MLASSGVVSASNVEMLSRLCFCSMRCVRSSMDTVSISPILSALESSDKMLLYGVSKHLIGRLTRKPCRSLYGESAPQGLWPAGAPHASLDDLGLQGMSSNTYHSNISPQHVLNHLCRSPTGIFTTVCVVSSLPGFSSRSGLTGILELASP